MIPTKKGTAVGNRRCLPKQPTKDILFLRAQFYSSIRHFFASKGFLEVETPLIVPSPDPSPFLDSFRVDYKCGNTSTLHQHFLHTSPEFAMKRLVTHGYEKIFQICKFFRNGEVSLHHNPEFTGLEWYWVGRDYQAIMELTEELFCSLWPSKECSFQGKTLRLETPWERLTVHEAFQRHANISFSPEMTRDELEKACAEKDVQFSQEDSWEDLFFKLFITFVEPKLGLEQPLFLTDYPIQLGALARAKSEQPHLAERVELYLGGLELANGYSELTDPVEQRTRWESEKKLREELGFFSDFDLDQGLLQALAIGMPPTTGVAVGLDRVFMLFADAATIQEVLPFPFTPSQR